MRVSHTSVISWNHSGAGATLAQKKAVVEWPKPQTQKELQRFLRFANFYRRFIGDFNKVIAPMTQIKLKQEIRNS